MLILSRLIDVDDHNRNYFPFSKQLARQRKLPVFLLEPFRTSALGQKQTLRSFRPMSALPPKADIAEHNWDVRFVQ
jgi:hypothetical protein